MEPSPYLPTTRRFVNPIYLRVEDIPRGRLPAGGRARSCSSGTPTTRAALNTAGRRSTATPSGRPSGRRWGSCFQLPRVARRGRRAFEAFVEREGQGLVDFATWCALAEEHGLPWRRLAGRAARPAVGRRRGARERTGRPGRRSTRGCSGSSTSSSPPRSARRREAGMAHRRRPRPRRRRAPGRRRRLGAGGRARPGVTVGAPPDAFNQQGQDWSQPPWRPGPAGRARLRAVPRHAAHGAAARRRHPGRPRASGCSGCGGCRTGAGPTQGTYVRYDHEALVGILALEAQRAGAVVIGEDLGTVEPWVRDYLRDARRPRHVDPVVRAGRARPAAAAGALARAVPGHRHHARPAADRGLPRRRALGAARPSSAC